MMDHAHSGPLQHHFDDLHQQYEAANMGMWAFIAQEIMFFGGLFCGYTVYRSQFPGAFMAGSYELDIRWGLFNTVVLIGSSLTMALGVRAAQMGKKNGIIAWLLATLFLGCVFLGVKAIEYTAKYDHHLIPGHNFHYAGHGRVQVEGTDASHGASGHAVSDAGETAHPAVVAAADHGEEGAHGGGGDEHHVVTVNPDHVEMFYGFYFVMTGMHALHMIIGVGIMLWMIINIIMLNIFQMFLH